MGSRKQTITVTESQLNRIVAEAVEEVLRERAGELYEGNFARRFGKYALGTAMALCGLNNAVGQNPSVAQTEISTSQSNCGEINEFNVEAVGHTRDEAVENAKARIKEWCDENGEKYVPVMMKGFEPRVVTSKQVNSNVNGVATQGDWYVQYRAMATLSQKYNGGSITISLG